MYFKKCEVKIVVNDKLSLCQRVGYWIKEAIIQSTLTGKEASGMTIEKVLLGSGLLKNENEYLSHTSIYPLKYVVKDKTKEKEKHYKPRLTVFIKFQIKKEGR